jgi:hypothetical protein
MVAAVLIDMAVQASFIFGGWIALTLFGAVLPVLALLSWSTEHGQRSGGLAR